jgi:hypothetical protein
VLRYDGTRPLVPVGDRFRREAYSLVAGAGSLRLDAFYVHGNDSSALGFGRAYSSGAGFVQVRADLSPRIFAVARYEGQDDGLDAFASFYNANPGLIVLSAYAGQGNAFGSFARQSVIGAGYSPSGRFRLTVEDAITHVPQTLHTLRVIAAFGASNAKLNAGY